MFLAFLLKINILLNISFRSLCMCTYLNLKFVLTK
uniref:Uncharacterized protein n=1 Tax=Arundo donax TaxID=35708 RepID=A0A0A9H4F0_ARUDO